MRYPLASLILLLPIATAQGQTVRGAGARPCAEWSQARRGGGRAFEAEQWTLGYMSALNVAVAGHQGGMFRLLDEKSTFSAVDLYCAQHPTDMVWSAVKSAVAGHGV